MKYDLIAIVDNGWYTFSPTGHANYNRHDEMKIHGKKQFMKYLRKNEKTALVKSLMNSWKPELVA